MALDFRQTLTAKEFYIKQKPYFLQYVSFFDYFCDPVNGELCIKIAVRTRATNQTWHIQLPAIMAVRWGISTLTNSFLILQFKIRDLKWGLLKVLKIQ